MYKTSGGIHPSKAAKFLRENSPALLEKVDWKKVDAVAFSQGPGLAPCLLVGLEQAKKIARERGVPLVGVNHCVSHIDVGKWDTGFKDPLVTYVSGANTQILGLKGGKYRIYGETLDVGLGNAIDVFGRSLGMEFPAGPKVESLAAKSQELVELSYTVKGMDLAFSGLVTAAQKKAKKVPREQLAYSFQETIFAMLVEVTERALAHTEKEEVLLVGGVAQNKRLREMFNGMAKTHGARFDAPRPAYNGDNGFMIALTGLKMLESGVKPGKPDIKPEWRTDQVDVKW
jgi:glycoprotease/Kae1 family metallohydrolase